MTCKYIKCAAELPDDAEYCHKCGKKQVIQSTTHKPRTRGNGMGSVYMLPNGKYRAAYTLGYKDGKRVYKTKSGFKTKKEAIAYLETLKTGNIADSNIKFADLYKEWSEQHYRKISINAENGYKAAYKNCPDLHYRRFTELKTRDLQAAVDACPFERRSKADIKSLINALYKYGIQNDYFQKNYAEFIKLPRKKKSTNDAFNEDEVKLFWDDYKSGNKFTGYILIMCYTGLRYGELSKIYKDNIFLDKRYMVGGIKTPAGIDRDIPIAKKILPIVKHFYNDNEKKLLEIPEKKFYSMFYDVLDRLGVRKLKPHCCRHTFSSKMAVAGVQPAVISESAGHEDYSTTMIYTHIPLNEKIKAVDTMK